MKTHYFHQREADLDDDLLLRYVQERVVPRTCLLGGMMVQLAHEGGADPCHSCPGPRDRCRGRPRHNKSAYLESAEAAVAIYQDGTEALTLKMIDHAATLARLLEEGPGP